MSRADVEAGVRAALEAAAEILDKQMWWEGRDKIRAIDPAAIAATVADQFEPLLDQAYLIGSNKRLTEELAALRDCDAKAEALDIILQAATEGTDWVYAEVPQQIAAMRRQLDVEKTACDEVLAENSALRQRIAELERQLAERIGYELGDGRK